MTIQTPVYVSTAPDDGQGDKLRDAFIKINERFQDIASLMQNRGNWTTGTQYEPRDYILEGGEAYVCVIAHTAGTFATDLASGKWASVDALDLRADLASTTNGKGAALVAFEGGGNVQDLKESQGSSLVGFLQSGTGAVQRTAQDKMREVVSVKDFGAVGDGVTDDTEAFTAALAVSKSVYVPYTADSFVVDGLNVDFGVKIWGPGTIKTSAGNLVQLGDVDLTPDAGPMRVMFVAEVNLNWEEFLNIRALGYNTIMPYLWNFPLEVVIKNAEAVGLNLIVHTRMIPSNQASWASLAAAAVAYDDRKSVVGYYVFDEPIINNITAANQQIGIDAVISAGGTKPIMTAENSVIYGNDAGGGNEFLASEYDTIFVDVYYSNTYTSANQSLDQYVRCHGMYGAINNKANLVPLVGLFNDTVGFGKSESLTTQLAKFLVNFSEDMQFGVFCWNQAGAIDKDARNTASYYECAATLPSIVKGIKPYSINFVPIGTISVPAASNLISSIIVNTVDAATPNITGGQSNVVPWYVENVGSAVSFRQQNFSANGLMIQNTGGRIGFSGMPSAFCAGFFRWDNRDDGTACTVNIGASETLGYGYVSAINVGIPNTTSAVLQGNLGSQFNLMPVLEISVTNPVDFPLCFLSGYVIFTDVYEVAF